MKLNAFPDRSGFRTGFTERHRALELEFISGRLIRILCRMIQEDSPEKCYRRNHRSAGQ